MDDRLKQDFTRRLSQCNSGGMIVIIYDILFAYMDDVKKAWLETLSDLNVCSQKGLVEMFDGSIGAGSVFMPYGGKYQLSEVQTMVAKLPVLKGNTDFVTHRDDKCRTEGKASFRLSFDNGI